MCRIVRRKWVRVSAHSSGVIRCFEASSSSAGVKALQMKGLSQVMENQNCCVDTSLQLWGILASELASQWWILLKQAAIVAMR